MRVCVPWVEVYALSFRILAPVQHSTESVSASNKKPPWAWPWRAWRLRALGSQLHIHNLQKFNGSSTT